MSTPNDLLPKSYRDLSVVITNAKGEVQEFQTEVKKIEIVESIHSHILHGTLELFDAVGIREFFEIRGEEKLQLQFTKGSLKIDHTFAIVSVDSINTAAGVPTFTVRFTSPETIDNYLKYISRSYKGTVDTIIEEIYSSQFELEIDALEKTNGVINYIAPNVRPFDAIKTLLRTSYNANYYPMSFHKRFLENSVNLLSYEALFDEEPIATYTFDPTKKFDGDALKSLGREENVNKIFSLSKDKFCDKEELLNYGVPSARTIRYDLIDKSYEVAYHEYAGENFLQDYTTKFGRPRVVGSNRLAFNSSSVENLVGVDQYSSMAALAHYNERDLITVAATINSHEEINVGMMIRFELDSVNPKVDENVFRDETLTGNYLINRLVHVIDKEKGYHVEGQFLKNKVKS